MSRARLFSLLALTASVSFAPHSLVAQVAGPFAAPPVRVARALPGQTLVDTSGGDVVGLVRAYLRAAGHDPATVASLVPTARDVTARTGVTHLRFEQRIDGIDVYGVYVKAAVSARGDLTNVIENVVPVGHSAAGTDVGAAQALAIGLRHVHGDAVVPPGLLRQQGNVSVFARTPFFHREPTATRVLVPTAAGLRTGYLVETWSERANQLHHTLIGPAGTVLGVEARTSADTYNVFAIDPLRSEQTIVAGPPPGTAGSPIGWLFGGAHTTTNIAGNNVHAYLDTDASNSPDGGGASVNDGAFETAADFTAQPSTTTNKAVGTQNLFYLNNVIHDVLHGHGFTAAAGNFQEDNFGLGGVGGDSVNAEVQDGSGVDNANFATPADGSNPRMQMYLWLGLGTHEVVVGGSRFVAQGAAFGPALDETGVSGPLGVVNDGSGTATDACERMPRNSLGGLIAVVDRGGCTFQVKVDNAQRAGAVGVIVANNVAGAIFSMGGDRARIPSVMVSLEDGAALKALPTGGATTLRAAATQPLSRDSSLDSDIVYHEYGHGLTWRMIGSMSGPLAGALGEGMSDVLAILLNSDDVVGEYAAGDPAGIRSAPYRAYARTYGDVGGTGVHFDGEVYGAIGWRLRENFLAASLSVDLLLDYLVDGMHHTPAGPAFEDMRDGILAAVGETGNGHECLVWDAFADFGVGVGARGTVRGPNVRVTESFDLPAFCTAIP